jgi:hypothetical protein
MIRPDSIHRVLSILNSEPSLTIAFGFALVCTGTFVRHLNWSRRNVEEHMPAELKGADKTLGSVAQVEFQLSATAMMSSTPQIPSELRQ